jgi:hypothetical protein
MITTALPSDLVHIEGAVDTRVEPGGLRPTRLPNWARAQVPTPFFGLVAEAAAGVRLRLRTAATIVELMVEVTSAEVPGVGVLPAVFDLRVDGQHTARVAAKGGNVVRLRAGSSAPEFVTGPTQVVRFVGLSGQLKEVELWLPHVATCDLVSLRTDAELVATEEPSAPKWVHYGSSISHCVEAEGPLGTWPATAANRSDLALTCLGFAGNAMLDPFVARAIRDLPADLISLKIGANIVEQATFRVRTFGPAVHGFLDTIREGHPDTPIVVISPVPMPVAEEHSGPVVPDPVAGPRALGTEADLAAGALSMRIVREQLCELVGERAARGDAVHYLSGLDLLGLSESADLYDGIHPNAAAYLRMGERFALALDALGVLPSSALSNKS